MFGCAVANETFERLPSRYSLICFLMTSIMLAISLDKISVMHAILILCTKTCKLKISFSFNCLLNIFHSGFLASVRTTWFVN